MANLSDISARILTGAQAARVPPNVTVKRINVDFLDTLANERKTNRSAVLDQLLDELRDSRAERKPEQPALPSRIDKALRLASQRSGQSTDQIIASALVEHLQLGEPA